MIASVGSKNLFCLLSYAVTVWHDTKFRFHVGQESERGVKVPPITEQRGSFANDIPCGVKRGVSSSRFSYQIAGMGMIGVFWIKAGVEKRGVAEHMGGKCHYFLSEREP
jgi:hypothetical protein